MSADGRFIAFDSYSGGVYVADSTSSQGPVLVSTDSNQNPVFGGAPEISRDGRYVAFTSGDSTLPGTSRADQLFLKDTQTGSLELVSSTQTGSPAATTPTATNQCGSFCSTLSYRAVISADDRFVAFGSDATNLDGTYRFDQIYIKDRQAGTVTHVAIPTVDGKEPNGGVMGVSGDGVKSFSMSADLRYIVFASPSTNIVGGSGANGQLGIFRLDRTNNSIVLVCGGPNGPEIDCDPEPSISDDGQTVLFFMYSSSATPFPGINNPSNSGIYAKNLQTGSVTWVDQGVDGSPANSPSSYPAALSGDGGTAAFGSNATNLDPTFVGGSLANVFVRQLSAHTAQRVSVAPGITWSLPGGNSEGEIAVSSSGQLVAFEGIPNNAIQSVNSIQIFVADRGVNTNGRHAIVYVGGAGSQSGCASPSSGPDPRLSQGAPRWLQSYLAALPNVDPTPYYFSYSDDWRDCTTGLLSRNSGELGEIPEYQQTDTCENSVETDAASLKGLIQRISDRNPGTDVVLIGHSQGGLVSSYLIGSLRTADPTFLSRIRAVVTFDSFPAGMPDADAGLADQFPPFNLCQSTAVNDLGQTVFDEWKQSSTVARTAAQASAIPFYTLAATTGTVATDAANTFSIGGTLGDNVTRLPGETFPAPGQEYLAQIEGASHTTIWSGGLPGALSTSLQQLDIKQMETIAACATLGYSSSQCGLSAETVLESQETPSVRAVDPEQGGCLSFKAGGSACLQPQSTSKQTFVFEQQLAQLTVPIGGLQSCGMFFDLGASDATGTAVTSFSPSYRLQASCPPSSQGTGFASPGQLGFYHVDPTTAALLYDGGTSNSSSLSVLANLNHMTEFALLADVTAPITNAALTGNQISTGTFAGPVSITLTAMDPLPGSGVAGTYYQLVPHGSAAPTNALPGLWQLYSTPVSIQPTADVDVYAFSVDNATNAENPQLLGILGMAPTVAITGAPIGAITVGSQISLAGQVSQGVAPFTYAWTKNGASFETAASITDTPAADTTYTLVVTDRLGLQSNTAQASVTIVPVDTSENGPGCDATACAPSPGATPELDSLVLFGSGLAGLGTWRLRRRNRKRSAPRSRHL